LAARPEHFQDLSILDPVLLSLRLRHIEAGVPISWLQRICQPR